MKKMKIKNELKIFILIYEEKYKKDKKYFIK